MNYLTYKTHIAEGDEVVLQLRYGYELVTVKTGGETRAQDDVFRHSDVIGKAYGSKIQASRGRGYAIALHPTPELWTQLLPHRTQILYAADIAFVIHMLDLRPGSIVIESGTGSGSLTHALARAVSPGGKVYTFDFHQGRVEKAREEFARHGLSDVIVSGHADAIRDGFGLEDAADAVFLDLPAPEQAVKHAIRALKRSGGRICSFSPCIEQVQATCAELHLLRSADVRTFEVLERRQESRTVVLPELDLAPRLPRTTTAATTTDTANNGDAAVEEAAEDVDDAQETNRAAAGGKRPKRNESSGPRKQTPMTMTYIQGEVQGHTGYLTFASVLHPDALQPSGAEVGEEQRGGAAGDAVAGEGGDAASAAATAAPAATGADNGNLSA